MAVLIQEVRGRQVNGYLLPDAAGVAFSRNQYRWSPRIDRRAGFLRLVWGLGTRAVEQADNDYPRLVALSHPELRPDTDPERILRYSQHFVDLIDTQVNSMRTLPVEKVLSGGLSSLRWIGQRYQGGALQDFVSAPLGMKSEEVVVTFSGLLRRTHFASNMTRVLQTLEAAYHRPVDVEFLALLDETEARRPEPTVYLLQCRPQSRMERERVELPTNVPKERQLFLSRRLVPDGKVTNVRYVVYISPYTFRDSVSAHDRPALARLVGRVNARLADETFILMGPGRWGSQNSSLGIPVGYGDIYHARALIEIVPDSRAPEPSYGTHFFQDLVEAGIYPLAVALGDRRDEFNREFFDASENSLKVLLPEDAEWEALVRVIEIPAVADGQVAELVMNGEASKAIAYLRAPVDS